MKEEHWRELEKITQDVHCPKLLQCYTTGLKMLCKENKGVRSQHLTSNDIGGLDITRKIKGSGLRK